MDEFKKVISEAYHLTFEGGGGVLDLVSATSSSPLINKADSFSSRKAVHDSELIKSEISLL